MSTDDPDADIVTVGAGAAEVIEDVLHERGLDTETAGLRIAVEPGGCAGRSYRFDVVPAPAAGDIVCEVGDTRVYVDGESRASLEGVDVQVDRSAHGTGFLIDNPNAEQACGCGLSFTREAGATD